MINKDTKEWAGVAEFINVPGLVKDIQHITDSARGKGFSNFLMALALLKNYRSFKSPKSFSLWDLMKKFDKSFHLVGKKDKYGKVEGDRSREEAEKRRQDPWNFMFIAGMWFQDLFNYDFRRTEMCIIPYATQEGEISFCAYNTGIGWRKIIENMHKNATVGEWYREHGKHGVYAKGKNVEVAPLVEQPSVLNIDAEDAARVKSHEHQVPMTAAEEAAARRKQAREAAKVREIYEELVLKKKPDPIVQIMPAPLAATKKEKEKEEENELAGIAGD